MAKRSTRKPSKPRGKARLSPKPAPKAPTRPKAPVKPKSSPKSKSPPQRRPRVNPARERARKGWITRRENERARERQRQERSERARNGWKTRRERELQDRADALFRGPRPPDDQAMIELAEDLDLDTSSLYDLLYGYEPGSHGG